METKKELREQLTESELRASRHFVKLRIIEKIIEDSDKNKELYAETVSKIKKELVDWNSN